MSSAKTVNEGSSRSLRDFEALRALGGLRTPLSKTSYAVVAELGVLQHDGSQSMRKIASAYWEFDKMRRWSCYLINAPSRVCAKVVSTGGLGVSAEDESGVESEERI